MGSSVKGSVFLLFYNHYFFILTILEVYSDSSVFQSQIDDQPVAHINDIEPLVCESSETIKFLVARPAQEVRRFETVFKGVSYGMYF